MAMGRTFEESLGKALVGLETDIAWFMPFEKYKGLPAPKETYVPTTDGIRWDLIETPNPLRIFALGDALRKGSATAESSAAMIEKLHEKSHIDPWFLERIQLMIAVEKKLIAEGWPCSKETLAEAKKRGWTDRAIAGVYTYFGKRGWTEDEIRVGREALGIFGAFQMVDTCAAEFEAQTPYMYSTYGYQDYARSDESRVSDRKKVMILGGGPNRIGQGIEFDYCCVHAAMELRALGIETIMVNSNPETVSTDFDISDKLYFEPLTPEHVLNIARVEKPIGAIVQFGGQTPAKTRESTRAGWVENSGHFDGLDRSRRKPRTLRSDGARARTPRS